MQDSLQLIADSIEQINQNDTFYQYFADSLLKAQIERANSYAAEAKAEENYKAFLAITSLVVIFGTFIVLQVLYKVYWDRGIYPPFLLNRAVNRYDAVVLMASNIIQKDSDSHFDKRLFLGSFMNTNYGQVKREVRESFRLACARPVSTKSVARWLNKHMKSNEEKQQLLAFLFELAVLDGQMGQKEHAELTMFCQQMGLSDNLLEQLVVKHRRERGERLYEEQQRRAQRVANPSDDLKEKHLATLELNGTFSEEELKKAYRRLAKTCHPDAAGDVGEAELAKLQERFLAIQEAYEYLNDLV